MRLFVLFLVACTASEIPGPQQKLRFGAGFFDAPFPIGERAHVREFPNPKDNAALAILLDALEGAEFGLNAAIFLPFDRPIDVPEEVLLLDLDDPARELPIRVALKTDAETYSPANLLVVLPEPGYPLAPSHRHGVVVLSDTLGSPQALEMLKQAQKPERADGATVALFERLFEVTDARGLDRKRIRAATAFVTGDPTQETREMMSALEASPAPLVSGLSVLVDHPTYCVIRGEFETPIFQSGERPYTTSGGLIEGSAQYMERVRFAVSIPKLEPRAWPTVIYVPGQGGLYTQFVDRGAQGGPEEGNGPARFLAQSAMAMASMEAPLTGPRHPNNSTSGLDFFNAFNPIAFRDNVRQGAFDFTMLRRAIEGLRVPAGMCGESSHTFLPSALFGHSTGATIGSVMLGASSGFSSGVLSGVGGSWLYNLTIKYEPVAFRPITGFVLGYDEGDIADEYDTALNLAQTLWDPIEPMVWAREWQRQVLLVAGINDGYFPAPAQKALQLAAHAPLVDDGYTLARSETVMIEHVSPPGITGHYAPFDTPACTYRYRCFLEDPSRVVPPQNDALAPCTP